MAISFSIIVLTALLGSSLAFVGVHTPPYAKLSKNVDVRTKRIVMRHRVFSERICTRSAAFHMSNMEETDDDFTEANDADIELRIQERARMKEAKRKKSSVDYSAGDAKGSSDIFKYFVPAFVGVWAVGYSAIFLYQMSYQVTGDTSSSMAAQQLGESGGVLGVGLTIFLFVALVGFAAYEVFKPEEAV